MTEDEEGLATDSANYTYGAVNDLNFSSVNRNGFKLTLNGNTVGEFGTGSRVVASAPFNRLYDARNLDINNFEFDNTSTDVSSSGIRIIDGKLSRCLATVGSTGTDTICIEAHNSSEIEACRTKSGSCGIRNRNATNTINANTTLDALIGFETTVPHTGIAKNNTTFGCTEDWVGDWSPGASNNNASEDGSHPGTSGVTITSDPFDADGFTPASGGQLDGAGEDLSISLDAANNSYNPTPSIGAYESIGGVTGISILRRRIEG